MDYYLYELVSNSIRSSIKKGIKAGSINKLGTWQRTWATLLAKRAIVADIASNILIHEQIWLNKPVCYLPENTALVTQLLKTNFEGQVDTLRCPRKMFMVPIPKGTLFNGQAIKGIFVSLLSVEEKYEMVEEFSQQFDAPIKFNFTDETGKQIGISYRDPFGKGMIVNNLPISKLRYVLACQTIEEFNELTKKTEKDDIFCYELSRTEQQTQFDVLRFVVAFVVYMSAHDDCVQTVESLKMKGKNKSTAYQINHIKQFKTSGKKTAHYRNLRHPRFYQGQYAKWEKGTRSDRKSVV